MNFLFPSFLWGLLAVAIPLIVHLFNFRRTKRVFFTNVAFLRQVNTQTSSFRRLKHLFVMAARMLFVASLVLAFAQPFIPSKNKTGFSKAGITSMYVDNSLSMQNEKDSKTLFDVAVGRVEELLGVFQGGSVQLQLLTNDFGPDEHGINNATQLKDRLASVRLSHTARNLENVWKRQQSLASKHSGGGRGNQFFWFSDFQKSTIGNLSQIKIDSTQQLFLVPVQGKTPQNVFIDSVWLNTPFIREMQGNRLSVKLKNTDTAPVSNLNVKLFIGDAQVSAQNISLAAQNTGTLGFDFTVKQKGYLKGRISFDDSPVSFDNDYYFVLNASPTIRVIHLYGSGVANGYVAKVFANDSLFAYQSFSAGNVDVGQLKTANLLILEGLEQIQGSLGTELQTFVQQGGSMLIIPPTKPQAASYTSFLSPFNIQGIMPNIAPPNTSSQALADPDRRSPFFTDIFEQSNIKELLQMPNVSPAWVWLGVSDKLLNFRSGTPFLSVSGVGQGGKVYLMASPLEAAYGDFARNALFVPVMYKIAAMSVRQEPVAYPFNENTLVIELKNSPNPNTVFKLKKDKLELIPIQKLNGKELLIELPKANQLQENQSIDAGYYSLETEGKQERLLAFNHNDQESEMATYTPEELRALLGSRKNIQIFDKIDEGQLVKEFKEKNLGIDLWKYFVIAALVFLLIEIGLIRFM